MSPLLKSGYLQDGLKAIIYFVPLIYLMVRKKHLDLRYFWLFFTGLSLLFFGNVLDFLDEFGFLRRMLDAEIHRQLQDFFEDVIGFTLGFAIFITALYMEFKTRKK